jgi:hypothetical protein
MNDNTRIRIAVPAYLYESVRKQLTLKESKQNLGAGMTAVKEKKNPSQPKAKKIQDEGFEDEIGYEAGEQHPDDEVGIPSTVDEAEETQADPKIEKFMKDNTSFVEKIKMMVGSDPKKLASLMSTITKKVQTDKKMVSTSDTKKAGEYMDKASGKKPGATTPEPVKK